MTKTFSDLLAMDKVARQYGCALKPALRAAMESDLRFPARAASPMPGEPLSDAELPTNVTRITGTPAGHERKRA